MQHGELGMWDEPTQSWVGSGIILGADRVLDFGRNTFRSVIHKPAEGDADQYTPPPAVLGHHKSWSLDLWRLDNISACGIKLTIDGHGEGGGADQWVPESYVCFGMSNTGTFGWTFGNTRINEEDDRALTVRGGDYRDEEGQPAPGVYSNGLPFYPAHEDLRILKAALVVNANGEEQGSPVNIKAFYELEAGRLKIVFDRRFATDAWEHSISGTASFAALFGAEVKTREYIIVTCRDVADGCKFRDPGRWSFFAFGPTT